MANDTDEDSKKDIEAITGHTTYVYIEASRLSAMVSELGVVETVSKVRPNAEGVSALCISVFFGLGGVREMYRKVWCKICFDTVFNL